MLCVTHFVKTTSMLTRVAGRCAAIAIDSVL